MEAVDDLNNSNNNFKLNTSNWEIYSIPLILLFLIVTGNFIGQLIPCKLQDSLTNNMYLKHLIAFLILLFVIEIGERKYNDFSELFLNALIVYTIFLLAIRLSLKFFLAFLLIILIIYTLFIYEQKQTHDSIDSIKEKVSEIKRVLYYVALAILIVGVIWNFNRKRIKYGKEFNVLSFFFASECQLKRKHEY